MPESNRRVRLLTIKQHLFNYVQYVYEERGEGGRTRRDAFCMLSLADCFPYYLARLFRKGLIFHFFIVHTTSEGFLVFFVSQVKESDVIPESRLCDSCYTTGNEIAFPSLLRCQWYNFYRKLFFKKWGFDWVRNCLILRCKTQFPCISSDKSFCYGLSS